MDSDTRHQLKQHELADALSKLRDWNNPSTRYTILGIAACAVIVCGYFAVRSMRQSALESTSKQLGQLAAEVSDPNQSDAAIPKLKTLIGDTSNPGLAGAARLCLARAQFDQGLRDPAQRPQAFKNAVDTYNDIVKTSGTPAEIEAAALFGLANAAESLRDFDQAKTAYQKLADPRFEGSPYTPLAAERLKDIDELKTPIALTPGLSPNAAPPPGVLDTQLRPVSPEQAAILNQQLGNALPAPAATPAPAPQPEQPATPPPEPKPAEPTPAPAPAPAPTPETPQTP